MTGCGGSLGETAEGGAISPVGVVVTPACR